MNIRRFKLFSLDALLATLFVYFILKFASFIFQLDMLDPIQSTLQNMEVPDLVFSRFLDHSKVPFDSNIVIINNGDLNRKQFAAELEIINRFEPKVIGIDALFRKKKTDELDIPLSEALSKIKNLVMVTKLEFKKSNEKMDMFDSIVHSIPMFNQYAKNGYANLIIDDETSFQTSRDFTPMQKTAFGNKIAFAPTVASFFDKVKSDKFLARNNETEAINFKRNIDKYKTLDVKYVFKNQDNLQFLKNKIVLIGYLGPNLTTKVTEDIFYTPLNKQYVGKADPDMYGIVIHANIISAILEQDFINSQPDWLTVPLLLFIVYFNMLILKYLRDHFEFWYQTMSIAITFSQLFLLSFVIMNALYLFKIEFRLNIVFPAILICVAAFETYTDSIKQIFLTFYKKLIKKFDKNIEENNNIPNLSEN